jgi:hypothetical protein
MLTIHQPFPITKASISGIVTLATGFFGTLGLLHTVLPETDTSPSESKTAQSPKSTPTASVSTDHKSNTSATNDTGTQPAASVQSTPTTVNKSNTAGVISPASTSTATSTTTLQVQPSSSTVTNTTQTPAGDTTQSVDPPLLSPQVTGIIDPVISTGTSLLP